MFHKQGGEGWGECAHLENSILCNCHKQSYWDVSTPSSFRLVSLLLFVFLPCCLIFSSIGSICSQNIIRAPMSAHLAIIVHTAAWWSVKYGLTATRWESSTFGFGPIHHSVKGRNHSPGPGTLVLRRQDPALWDVEFAVLKSSTEKYSGWS